MSLYIFSPLLCNKLYFLEQFQSHCKIEWKLQTPCIALCVQTCIASPVINIPLQSGTFVIHTPISAHHHHPKSIMYIWTHSWCCIFCVFAWVYKYVYLPLYFIHSIFTALNDYLFLPPFLQISGNYSLLNFLQKKRKKVVTQSCSTLCDPMDCSPPGSSVHGILQARMLE